MLQHTDETAGSGRSLADQAFLRLQDRLILLDIPPGSPLNEARLSEDLGVGRTPLREALKRLESEHLVVTYPRRGTFATTVDITALSEISQVREVLEPLAARLAAERRGGAARERLERLREQLEEPAAEDREDTLRWDVAIHRAVYAAAGNAHLETTLTRYGNLATRIWCVAADRIPQLQEHISVHTALLTAVLDGREQEAATIMLEHIRDFEEQVRKVL
ncbi:GntR family transcriptional regulator [Kocuria sp. CH-021]|uniref:GntR family transcriptional regulator n=1 Tax=Kocuria sp. CH-021 TaxID=3406735 RepID=UPI003C7638B2